MLPLDSYLPGLFVLPEAGDGEEKEALRSKRKEKRKEWEGLSQAVCPRRRV